MASLAEGVPAAPAVRIRGGRVKPERIEISALVGLPERLDKVEETEDEAEHSFSLQGHG